MNRQVISLFYNEQDHKEAKYLLWWIGRTGKIMLKGVFAIQIYLSISEAAITQYASFKPFIINWRLVRQLFYC